MHNILLMRHNLNEFNLNSFHLKLVHVSAEYVIIVGLNVVSKRGSVYVKG